MATYLVTDEGTGLCAAQKEALADIIRQPDTLHAIAHQLGKWVNRLEQAAFKAIGKEYNCWDTLDSAKSEAVIMARIAAYEEAAKNAEAAIELYETFSFLYRAIIKELNLFDPNGNLRNRQDAQESIEAGLKKSKKASARKICRENEQFCIEFTTGHLQEDCEIVKEQVYGQLDQIVQSSALVECINSIIRPYLNGSKNHVTQETLNLIMFYHNHRRYKSGKRAEQTPTKILTGKKQEKDWIDLLFEVIREKDQSVSASAV